LTLPGMRELSVAEQRYQAVLAVIAEGATVTEVGGRWGVSRQSVHAWLARYEAGGLEGLADRLWTAMRTCFALGPGEHRADCRDLHGASLYRPKPVDMQNDGYLRCCAVRPDRCRPGALCRRDCRPGEGGAGCPGSVVGPFLSAGGFGRTMTGMGIRLSCGLRG
jgi:hypothetical protein